MRVLLLGYRGNPFCGGQGIYIYYLSKELSKLGVKVDVMAGPPYPENVGEWADFYPIENFNLWSVKTKQIPAERLRRLNNPFHFMDYLLTRVHIFPEMETFSFRAFSELKKILKKKDYDIIHDVNTLGWGLLPMKGYGIPIVSTIHHPLTRDREADIARDKSFWEKMMTILFYPLNMQKFVIKRIDNVITSFKEGVHELNSAFGVNPEKVSVVYNGMDVETFKNTGEPRNENELLFVGNTEDYKKGIEFLLEAMTLLPDEISLKIVDEGPPKKYNCTRLIKKHGLEKRVKLTGRVDNETLVSLYSKASILVMSSLYEGFGLPAAEAMACETPVIATTVGALNEIVTEETGLLVPPKNPTALKDSILSLMNNQKLRHEMGKRGREWAESQFAWPVAAKNTLEVYQKVVDEYRRKK